VIVKRVLVIDDEDDIREVAQASLEIMAGLEVILACSSREGLSKAETEHPDVILLDVMMPDMDGIAALKQLQSNPVTQQIPVIFLTAKVQVSDQAYFKKLGARAIIAKPFKPHQLASQLLAILD
jgi:CheY-like chemotaxis protein